MRPLAMTAALVAAAALCACGDDEGDRSKRDPASFSADVDNRYWPLEPGTRWIYREVDEEGRELRVVVTATTETRKLANGVTARVVRDTVLDGRELVEDTFDWYAQDDEGNVWYMGERTAEYEGGRLATRAGSWEAGVDGARPGTLMPAAPRDDMRYRQEYYAGEAEDSGEILAVDEQVQVPAGHFDEAVLTKDTNALEPKVLEYKLYAPGVGMALALGVSGGGGREELLRMERVDPDVARAAGTAPLGEPYPR